MILDVAVFQDLQDYIAAATRAANGLHAEAIRREVRAEHYAQRQLEAAGEDPVAEAVALRRENENILQIGELQRMRAHIVNARDVLVATLASMRCS